MSTQEKYRADIDGLRAVAVLAVIGFHAFPSWMTGGFVGVDVFFVISGFLITSIILGHLHDGRFSFVEFYARRIRRIFPALIVVLLAFLALGWFTLFADEYRQLAKHIVGSVAFVSNLLLWRESGYFDAAAGVKPLLHLWSLGIEEQFYLAWPLICYLAYRSRVTFVWILSVLLGASFLLNVLTVVDHSTAAFYNPLTRLWELMMGGTLAWSAQPTRVSDEAPRLGSIAGFILGTGHDDARVDDARSVIGVACVLLAIFFLTQNLAFPGWWALPATLGTFLLICAGPGAVINRVVLSHPALVGVGLISYPLYLWHWPLLSLAQIMESGPPSAAVRWAMVAASFVLAWLTYVLIEKPIRFGGYRTSKALALCVAMIGVGGAGLYVYRHTGFPLRYPIQEAQLQSVTRHFESTQACKTAVKLSDPRYCLLNDPARPPTVALIGDSHANRLYFGLNERFASIGENLLQLGGGGCVPFWDIETGKVGEPNNCDQQMRPQLDYVLKSGSIRTVIFANRGTLHIEGTDLYTPGNRYFIRDVRDSDPHDAARTYEKALREAVERFTRAGKRVVLVMDEPELDQNPLVCLGQTVKRPISLTNSSPRECPRMSRSDVERRDSGYLRITRSVASGFPGISVIDLRDALCDEKFCYALRDGKLLYMDPDHLSEDGSDYVASRLWNAFRP